MVMSNNGFSGVSVGSFGTEHKAGQKLPDMPTGSLEFKEDGVELSITTDGDVTKIEATIKDDSKLSVVRSLIMDYLDVRIADG